MKLFYEQIKWWWTSALSYRRDSEVQFTNHAQECPGISASII